MRPFLAIVFVAILSATTLAPAARAATSDLHGNIVVNPSIPEWLFYEDGTPLFICAPGDPEGFLFRGTQNADRTWTGDQDALLDRLIGTGANGIYLVAVQSDGGDGGIGRNPFNVQNDPTSGLNQAVLDQWEVWFDRMDDAGIVIYFFIYDDDADPWEPDVSLADMTPDEAQFVRDLVDAFKHHKNLIWVVAEEHQEELSVARVSQVAAEIRSRDPWHPIASHQKPGLDHTHGDDPNIDQFSIQYCSSNCVPDQYNGGMRTGWTKSAGRYNLNHSEVPNGGVGNDDNARRKIWASAMGGAYVMVNGWNIDDTPLARLNECGYMVDFFESSRIYEMAPDNTLAFGDTSYVLANPGVSYVLYALNPAGNVGLTGMTAGTYDFVWLDAITGNIVTEQDVVVGAGDQSWPRPVGIGDELALYIVLQGSEPTCDQRPNFGLPCTSGIGACEQVGSFVCADPGSLIEIPSCDAIAGSPLTELCNGVDDNCDGSVDEPFDSDLDGHVDIACPGGSDCNDTDAGIHPAAVEICDNAIDDDCDGLSTTCTCN